MTKELFNNYMYDISCKIEENTEDFIITTISTFCGVDRELSKYPVSKEIIRRALIRFRIEHPHEYNALLDASYDRIKAESEE